MKRILYLLTAILLTASVANAQIQKGSIWYEDYYKLNCLSVSGNTITSRKGSWICTWSKDGKKLSARSVN